MSVLRLWLLRPLLLVVGVWPWLVTAAGFEPLLSLTRSVSQLLCHAQPGRALLFGGEEMPLCSRCAGLLLGAALGALIRRPQLQGARLTVALTFGAGVMFLHVIAQEAGWIAVHHPSRLATGLLLGWVASVGLATYARPWPRTRVPGLS